MPGSGRFPGEGNGNPLQYSSLENPQGQRSLVGYSPRGCKESDTRVSNTHTHRHTYIYHICGFPGGASGKESACQCKRQKRRMFDPWVGKIPWGRAWQLTPVFLPGESHGQRSLAGYSPWGCKESDMTDLTGMCVVGFIAESYSMLFIPRVTLGQSLASQILGLFCPFPRKSGKEGRGWDSGRQAPLAPRLVSALRLLLTFLVLAGSGTCWGSSLSCGFHLPVINSISCWRTGSLSIGCLQGSGTW